MYVIIEDVLDLNELERMLDESLEKETSESLKDWMMNRRVCSLYNFIDDKDDLREYEYFIMTERGNTFEKL